MVRAGKVRAGGGEGRQGERQQVQRAHMQPTVHALVVDGELLQVLVHKERTELVPCHGWVG